MDGCTAIIFCKTCQIGFVQVGVVCAASSIAGDFHNKATIGASALLCVQWQNLDGDSFDMLYKNDCWAAIPDPIWTISVPYESFAISFFNFEEFWVKPGFPFTQLNRANTQNLENFIFWHVLQKWLLSSHLLSNMHDQCIIWKRNNCTIIPCY